MVTNNQNLINLIINILSINKNLRVWVNSYIKKVIRNKVEDVKPWDTIKIIIPTIPIDIVKVIDKITNAICATEEYATIDLISTWERAIMETIKVEMIEIEINK